MSDQEDLFGDNSPVQAQAVIPEAIAVPDMGPIRIGSLRVFLGPEDEVLEPAEDENSPVARRGRSTERERPQRIARFESASPPPPLERGVDHMIDAITQRLSRFHITVGAQVVDWMVLIDQAEAEEKIQPVATTLKNLFAQWSNGMELPGVAEEAISLHNAREEEEDYAKYVEAVFVKKTGTHHSVYTGNKGGKYFYDHNGQKKYIKPDQAKFVNPDTVAVCNANPSLQTTTVSASRDRI